MALRAVPDHPKFADLKRRLEIPRFVAIGLLEAVWHFCGRFTPQGNIGKYSDSAIEAWIEWNGNPGAAVAALVETGWLDRHDEYRLVVHDWSTWADEVVQTTLARNCDLFCDGSAPATRRLNQRERAKLAATVQTSLHKVQPQRRQSQPKSAIVTKPEPEPEPEPVPVPEPKTYMASDEAACAAAAGNGAGHLFALEPPVARPTLRDLGWKGVKDTPEDVIQKLAELADYGGYPENARLDSEWMTLVRLEWFEDSWAGYWRKDKKRPARTAYFKAVTTLARKDELDMGVIRQSPLMEARPPDKRPQFATWINQERWNDVVEAAK